MGACQLEVVGDRGWRGIAGWRGVLGVGIGTIVAALVGVQKAVANDPNPVVEVYVVLLRVAPAVRLLAALGGVAVVDAPVVVLAVGLVAAVIAIAVVIVAATVAVPAAIVAL